MPISTRKPILENVMKNTPIKPTCFVKTGALRATKWNRDSIANALRDLRKHAPVLCKRTPDGLRAYYAEVSWAVRVYFVGGAL